MLAASQPSGWLNASTLASLLITIAVLVGLALRHNRRLHPAIMSGCFAGDVALVLWLELTRGAVETAVGSMSALMVTHIALATVMLVLYVFMTVSGVKILKAGELASDPTTLKRISRHRIGAWIFVAVRVLVLVTAVMVANQVRAEPDLAPSDNGKSQGGNAKPEPRVIPAKGSGITPP